VPEATTLFFVVVGLASFLVGVGKGGLGGMLGALATVLMAFVIPVDRVIGLMLPLLLFADVFAISFHWRRWDWRLGGCCCWEPSRVSRSAPGSSPVRRPTA
jgi:uncharacterized membrane protein YfcA